MGSQNSPLMNDKSLEAVAYIMLGMLISSPEEKQNSLNMILETIRQMHLDSLNFKINDKGLDDSVSKDILTQCTKYAFQYGSALLIDEKASELEIIAIAKKLFENFNDQERTDFLADRTNQSLVDTLTSFFNKSSTNEKFYIGNPSITLALILTPAGIGLQRAGRGALKIGKKATGEAKAPGTTTQAGAKASGEAVEEVIYEHKKKPSFTEELILRLFTIEEKDNNFDRVDFILRGMEKEDSNEEIERLTNIVNILQDEHHQKTIKNFIKKGHVTGISKQDMLNLIRLGSSTHTQEIHEFIYLLHKFNDAIDADKVKAAATPSTGMKGTDTDKHTDSGRGL